MPNTKYRFTMAPAKQPKKKFIYYARVNPGESVEDAKTAACEYFKRIWGTPVKVLKAEVDRDVENTENPN